MYQIEDIYFIKQYITIHQLVQDPKIRTKIYERILHAFSVLFFATFIFVFFYRFYIKLLQSVTRIIQVLLTIPQVTIDSGQVVNLLFSPLHHDPLHIPIVPTPDHISILLCHLHT